MSIQNPKKSILRKNPYRDRRSFIARMNPLSPIGDIANATLTESAQETLTWETASDWDNATAEKSVAHESIGDKAGDGTIQLGYPSYDPNGSSLAAYWSFDDDSGPITDHVGSNDLSVNGDPTAEATGLANSTEWSLDGSGDYFVVNHDTALDLTGAFTVSFWIKYASTPSTYYRQLSKDGHNTNWETLNESGTTSHWFRSQTNGDLHRQSTTNIGTGSYGMVTFTIDPSGGESRAYTNGSFDNSESISGSEDAGSTLYFGTSDGSQAFVDGELGEILVFTRVLSDSEVAELYDISTDGYLTTATKSFSATKQPNLQNLSYSLNSQSITLDVIGSPGTASEEVVSQTLDGSASYDLTWSNSHTDFRIEPNISTGDPTTSPTFSRGELVG